MTWIIHPRVLHAVTTEEVRLNIVTLVLLLTMMMMVTLSDYYIDRIEQHHPSIDVRWTSASLCLEKAVNVCRRVKLIIRCWLHRKITRAVLTDYTAAAAWETTDWQTDIGSRLNGWYGWLVGWLEIAARHADRHYKWLHKRIRAPVTSLLLR